MSKPQKKSPLEPSYAQPTPEPSRPTPEPAAPEPPLSFCRTPCAVPVSGEPTDVWDQINKYGTYQVQDTTDTDNVFPLIGPAGAGSSGIILPEAVFAKDAEKAGQPADDDETEPQDG